MQACLDIVLPYVHERQQFGQPIGEFQLIQARAWLRSTGRFRGSDSSLVDARISQSENAHQA